MTSKKLETVLVSAGRKPSFTHGSVNPVIQRASSLVFDSVQHKKKATAGRASGELFYGRRGTLTHFSLQQSMVELEGVPAARSIPAVPQQSAMRFFPSSRRAIIYW
ncbi:Cystathionine beta-lyase MetC [Sodalis praecaptivus]